jgi:ElaB/YqjD/DUF883 family membrane-anchored ribosome-binding protein
MNSTREADAAKERLMKDFKAVLGDTEELLRATASQTGEKVASARARVEESLMTTKKRIADLEESVVDRTKAAAHAADQMVHENPWKAVGVAAAVGFLLGLLVHRRD